MDRPEPMCGSCKRSGIYNVPAEVEFSGYKFDRYDRKVNVSGAKYCRDHFYCFTQDGGTVTKRRDITRAGGAA
jgi:hypothetical protein